MTARTFLITGASKGIGRAIALQLAADGFTVGVHYHRDAAGAQETLDAIVQAGGTGRLLAFDVGNREQCRAVLEQETPERAREVIDPATADAAYEATFARVRQMAPCFSLRGGTREVLRGIIARGLGLR